MTLSFKLISIDVVCITVADLVRCVNRSRMMVGSAMTPNVQMTTSSSVGEAFASLTKLTNAPFMLHHASTPLTHAVPLISLLDT